MSAKERLKIEMGDLRERGEVKWTDGKGRINAEGEEERKRKVRKERRSMGQNANALC